MRQAMPELNEAAVGIAGADRHLPGKAGAERPMDGLEACRRSATALMLRMRVGSGFGFGFNRRNDRPQAVAPGRAQVVEQL